jgi:hypothetical protein
MSRPAQYILKDCRLHLHCIHPRPRWTPQTSPLRDCWYHSSLDLRRHSQLPKPRRDEARPLRSRSNLPLPRVHHILPIFRTHLLGLHVRSNAHANPSTRERIRNWNRKLAHRHVLRTSEPHRLRQHRLEVLLRFRGIQYCHHLPRYLFLFQGNEEGQSGRYRFAVWGEGSRDLTR